MQRPWKNAVYWLPPLPTVAWDFQHQPTVNKIGYSFAQGQSQWSRFLSWWSFNQVTLVCILFTKANQYTSYTSWALAFLFFFVRRVNTYVQLHHDFLLVMPWYPQAVNPISLSSSYQVHCNSIDKEKYYIGQWFQTKKRRLERFDYKECFFTTWISYVIPDNYWPIFVKYT